jgi:hypothetical protein
LVEAAQEVLDTARTTLAERPRRSGGVNATEVLDEWRDDAAVYCLLLSSVAAKKLP